MRWAAIVCLAIFGCSKPPLILELDEGTQSLVVVIDDETQPRLRAFAITDGFVFRESFDSGDLVLRALMYDRSLQELGLLEGDRPLLSQSAMTRGLPTPETAYLADGGEWGTEPVGESVSDVAFARTEVRKCIEQEGCLSAVEGLEGLVCRTPCTEPMRPTPPEPPAPPDFGTCPEGWVSTELEGNRYCEPWAGGNAPTCGEFEVAWPGRACAAVGPDCPADGWPTEAATLFVDPAGNGGAGTRADPFSTIEAALNQAVAGDVIALRRGRHGGSFDLVDGVTLVGACVADVEIRPLGSRTAFTVPAGVTATVKNVNFQGSGAVAEVAGQLSVTALMADGGLGFRVTDSGRLDLDSVWIDRGRSTAVNLRGSAQVETRRFAAFDTPTVFYLEAAGVTLTASVTYATGSNTPVFVAGGEANLFQAVLVDASSNSIFGQGDDAVINAEQVVLRQSPAHIGGGVRLSTGATANLKKLAILNDGAFVAIYGEASDVFAEDVLIVRDEDHPNPMRGIGAAASATVEVTRAYVTRVVALGAYSFGVDARLRLFDTTIRDVKQLELNGNGTGVFTEDNGFISLVRVVVEEPRGIGMYAKLGGRIEATDLVLRRVQPRLQVNGRSVLGRGLEVVEGASADITRAQFLDNRNCAVFASDSNTEVTLDEVELAGTRSSDCDEFWCQTTFADGSSIILQALATFTNVWVHDNEQYGLRVQTQKGLRVTGGLVENNSTGLEVSHPEFDFADVAVNVLYRDNQVPLVDLAANN